VIIHLSIPRCWLIGRSVSSIYTGRVRVNRETIKCRDFSCCRDCRSTRGQGMYHVSLRSLTKSIQSLVTSHVYSGVSSRLYCVGQQIRVRSRVVSFTLHAKGSLHHPGSYYVLLLMTSFLSQPYTTDKVFAGEISSM
jgi:hypothetical protein